MNNDTLLEINQLQIDFAGNDGVVHAIQDLNLNLKIRTNQSGCLGICDYGPTVAVYPEGIFYVNVQKDDVNEIITSHIINNKPVERLLLQNAKK